MDNNFNQQLLRRASALHPHLRDDMFPLPLDRNGKVIRFGDTVQAVGDAGTFVVHSIRVFGVGDAAVYGRDRAGRAASSVEVVEEPFAEWFRQRDIVTASRFGGDRVRVIGWVPERNSYLCVWLDDRRFLVSIRESDNPTLVERAS